LLGFFFFLSPFFFLFFFPLFLFPTWCHGCGWEVLFVVCWLVVSGWVPNSFTQPPPPPPPPPIHAPTWLTHIIGFWFSYKLRWLNHLVPCRLSLVSWEQHGEDFGW
jgi:hypothetical protein